jgi:nicotinate-nucleotide adenylyltransferase
MGHVLLAACGLVGLGLDEIWLIPCRNHPFGKTLTPFDDRVKMCHLAVASLGGKVKVDDIEGRIGDESDPSPMIETLEALRERHPDAAFRLLIGSDLVAELDQWKEIDRVRALAPPLVVPRVGHSLPASENDQPEALPALSSRAVRERAESGQPLEGWVPNAVATYIRSKGLYKADAVR